METVRGHQSKSSQLWPCLEPGGANDPGDRFQNLTQEILIYLTWLRSGLLSFLKSLMASRYVLSEVGTLLEHFSACISCSISCTCFAKLSVVRKMQQKKPPRLGLPWWASGQTSKPMQAAWVRSWVKGTDPTMQLRPGQPNWLINIKNKSL